MAPTPVIDPAEPAATGSRLPRWAGWKRWLLLGACFGLGYGITQRLVTIDLGPGWSAPERFGVKPFPGTELNSLRRRFGDEAQPIRGDLDLLDLERQQERQEAAIDKRRAEMEARENSQRQEPDGQRSPEPVELPPAQAPAPDPEPQLQPPSPPTTVNPPAPAPATTLP